jgi:hypothetical protein
LAKKSSRENASVREVLATEVCFLIAATVHVQALLAQADAYLEDVRAATAAAHDRVTEGIRRLHPQAFVDEPVSAALVGGFPEELDPIFATREFDVPQAAVGGLIDWKES